MNECLFCKICKGQEKSYTLFEDEKIRIILDAFPNSPGHTLILPKEHFKDLDDIDMDTLTHIMSASKKIKLLLEEKLNPDSIILIQNNGEAEKIKHFHLHLIPKYNKEIKLSVEEIFNVLTSKEN